MQPPRQPPPPRRSIRTWLPQVGFIDSPVSTAATAPAVGGVAPAPRPIMGSDTQSIVLACPALTGGSAALVSGTVPFPNIPGFTTGKQDAAFFHVYPIHFAGLPGGVTATVTNITPKSFQSTAGPAVYPNTGAPFLPQTQGTGLAPGVPYQSFSALVTVLFQNCETVNTAGANVTVLLGAHIINSTG